jgi:membrane protease YdiL (CAAX protease family)
LSLARCKALKGLYRYFSRKRINQVHQETSGNEYFRRRTKHNRNIYHTIISMRSNNINQRCTSSGGTAAVMVAFTTLCFLISFGTLTFAFTTTTTTTPTTTALFHVQRNQRQQRFVADFYHPTASTTTTTLSYYSRSNNKPSPFSSLFPTSPGSSPCHTLTVRRAITSEDDNDDDVDDRLAFNFRTTIALVGGQSILIGVAIIVAKFCGTPNLGFGPSIDFSLPSIGLGILWSLPLGVLGVVLDLVEDKFPALQDVTKATQSSVLSLLGGKFKPIVGTITALALGVAAGLGEEMLFRGVLQNELGIRIGSDYIAVGIASIIFGALHAVTPLYAGLAGLASVYFGWLYLATGNLAIPIVTHAFYDWAALLYAHWTVANLNDNEKQSLLEWGLGGASDDDAADRDE